MTAFQYHPYYCEENVWQLCCNQKLKSLKKKVVFISNPTKTCPMWHARASSEPGEPVLWDYHVILVCKNPLWQVWDLDSTLGLPLTPRKYLSNTFRPNLPKELQPMFRVVDANEFVEHFSSDRSHMKLEDGSWRSPPPEWPAIYNGEASNLSQFTDMNQEFIGKVMNLDSFRQMLIGEIKGAGRLLR